MKYLLLTSLLLVFSFSKINAQQDPHKVQVAILFDTSNSMDGLIDQAKSRIWSIINEISQLSYNGQIPDIEFALYQYGNSGLSMQSNYIQQILPFSSDLDTLSQLLFGLRTNGGEEFCGAVIEQALTHLTWSPNTEDLRMIYIAGNESYAQGPVSYKTQCTNAKTKDICINTIFCGGYEEGIRLNWQDGASCSGCDYFNINSDRQITHIATPYDSLINAYNDSLNTTYIGFGSYGAMKKSMQVSEDANAEEQDKAVKAERSIAKSNAAVYKNSTWDLVDAVEEGKNIAEIKDEDLPEEFRGKTLEEKQALIEQKKADRSRYQKEIAQMATERQNYINEEMKKKTGEEADDFGTSVNASIAKKAESKGYEKIQNP